VRASQAPLPGKVAALLRESLRIVLIAAAVYLALILLTFNRADPGWSHSDAVDRVHNSGGRLGAWIADVMLYLFGISAFWWVLLLV
jgi:S-DNA-T family DNA segregation ATPase FtsK/SpoIIIE